MTDIATLGIKVDSSQADNAASDLDKLTTSGAAAEKQTNELTQAARALNAEHAKVSAGGIAVASAATKAAGGMKLTAAEALNLSRQMADVGVTLAMGMNPFMVLLQQGPQIGDIMKTSGLGVKGLAVELGLMFGLLKKTQVGTIDLSVAEAELAAATEAVAAAQAAAMLSTDRLGAQRMVAAAQAREAAAANALMEESAAAAAAAEGVALAPIAAVLAGIAAAAAVAAGGFALFANEVEKGVDKSGKDLGLTEKQLDRLKQKGVDTGVTMGDAFLGFYDTVKDRITKAFGPQIDWVSKKFDEFYKFVVDGTVATVKTIVGGFVGSVYAIKAAWQVLPGAIGDIVIQAANATIRGIEDMVNAAIARLNALAALANKILPENLQIGKLGNVSMGQLSNPYAGQASKAGAAIGGAFNEGYGAGSQAVDDFGSDWAANTRNRRKKRVTEAAGDAGKDGADKKGGQKDGADKKGGQSEFEKQTKAAEDYIKSLKEETAEIGKNRIEVKMMAADRAAALAPTQKLKEEILSTAEAWKKATLAQATKEFKQSLQDQIEAEQFETALIGKNAKEREVAIAMHNLEIRVRDLARQGIILSADAIAEETAAIRANAEARGQSKLDVDNAKEYTAAMQELNDTMRDAVEGFGELFGTAGAGFENLINVIADYGDKVAEIQQRIAEATASGNEEERQRATEELSRAQIKHYGDMLGAAKTFFKEGTTGYKVLEAAERAYRLYQMISFAIETANKVRAIAVDTAHTASHVANSTTRASASGIEAVAKAIASLPFPLNLVAGAATIAALVAVGVKMMGGGGGGGASAASASTSSSNADDGSNRLSSSMTSPYSTMPGQGGLYDPKNAGKDGAGLASPSNDNFAANNTAQGSSGSTFVYAPTIQADNAEAGTVQQIQDMLKANQQETIQLARQASAADRQAAASRQRIGNG